MDRRESGRLPAGFLGPRDGQADRQRVLPPIAAILVAAAVYGLLPASLLFLPRIVVPAIEIVLCVLVVITRRLHAEGGRRWSRRLALVEASLMILANLVSLGYLVARLGSDESGGAMLFGAMQVWLTNVIGFGLFFWELDRGGPMVRHCEPRWRMPLADFRFSQDENRDTVEEVKAGGSEEGWMPEFVDYFYLSLTCSSAFSPTDTMPLSARAKLLMGLEATSGLLVTLLIVARAVGSIAGG